MKRLIYLFFLIGTSCFAQKNFLSFDLIRSVDFINTSALFSYERIERNKFGFGAEIGYMHRWFYFHSVPDEWSKNRGIIAGVEAKWIVPGLENDKVEPWFVGLKVRHLRSNFTRQFGFWSDSLALAGGVGTGKTNYEPTFRQTKTVTGLYAIGGIKIEGVWRLWFEFTGGIGAGIREVKNHFPPDAPTDLGNPYFGEAIRMTLVNADFERTWFPLLLVNVKMGVVW